MNSTTSAIYSPRGKAREYCPLAVNLYKGCSHKCEYCYAPACTYKSRSEFSIPTPRAGIIETIEKDAKTLQLSGSTDPVLLCFTCDPYQPIDCKYQFTRKTIQILHNHEINVMILTKGGKRAERDFDSLTENDWFGVTLTTIDNGSSHKWEPGADTPINRINSLRLAHEKGIKTWVSLEPVLYPEVALEIIKCTHQFVDKFKVGVLNYHPHAKSINWYKFAHDVDKLLTDLNADYYLKNDLKKYLDD